MRMGRILSIFGVSLTLLSLVVLSPLAGVASTPPAAPNLQAPDPPPPEIRAGGFNDDYELPAIAGKTREWKDGFIPEGLSPSAVEGQPRALDWTPVRRVAVRPGYPQTLYATLGNEYGLWRSTNGGVFWDRLPFGVGSGYVILFANTQTAIATFGYWDGSKYANGGIWHTSDGGNVWEDVSGSIVNEVYGAAFDPTDPDRIYAATLGGGIYRGDYSGGSVAWTQINAGLADTFIYSIAVSPSHPNVLYAGGFDWVYYSDDYGDSWVIADNTYPSYYTEAVAVSPSNPNIFYTGARRLDTSGPLTYGGFYKSVTGAGDGNLVLKNSGMQDTFVLDIAQDPVNPNILYAGTWASGFFRSDDGGTTWLEKNGGLALPYIYGIEAVQDPGNSSNTILYVATFYSDAGVFVSTDRGDTWTDPWGAPFLSMFDITTTSDAYHLAAATGDGVLVSPDGGVNWWWSQNLTDSRDGIVLELARDPNNSSKLLAATYGGGIWTSTNAGGSWTETSTGIGGSSVVFDVAFRPGSSSTAYAGSWGVFHSTDGGSTWAALGTLPEPSWVRDVDALGASSYDLFAGTHDKGVFMSPGATGSWTTINDGLTDYRMRSVKAIESNRVFAGTSGSSAWEYNGWWTKRGPYIRAPSVIQMAIHPTNSAIIYAATDQGVYKSTDGGESWVPKNQGLGGYGDLKNSGISIDPSNTSTIYLGTWGYGIFKSTDSGDHWTRLSDPLKCSKTYLPLVVRNYAPPVPDVPLVNGDFEQGPGVGWGQYADHGYNIIRHQDYLPVYPHSGEWATWLGGAYDNFSVIWQDATVPVSDPTLRFYRWDASEDSCGNDYGLIYINGGNPYAYWDLCESTNTNGWMWTGVDLSPFAGQTVEIAIAAQTNSTLNSNSFIDDVTLGSTSQADAGIHEEPFDYAATLQEIPELGPAQKLTSEPPFRPPREPIEPHGLLDLSD